MLLLSRKLGAEIVISGGIKITVLQIGIAQVRLGVTAPAEISIRRGRSDEPGAPDPLENKPR